VATHNSSCGEHAPDALRCLRRCIVDRADRSVIHRELTDRPTARAKQWASFRDSGVHGLEPVYLQYTASGFSARNRDLRGVAAR